MNAKKAEETLLRNVRLLSDPSEKIESTLPFGSTPPSTDDLRKIIDLIKLVIFPGFFNVRRSNESVLKYYIGVHLDNLYTLLKQQIMRGLYFCGEKTPDVALYYESERLALEFIDRLPLIKRLLYSDVEAMFTNDPAVDNYGEVIFCYPNIQAMIHYRVAHELLILGVPVIPRIITELAHSVTGIDIHPGAEIGEYFSIDHGTGVVIGETCIIGNHVTLYQGVTLGAKNFSLDRHGHPINIPRHPILEDNVTVYSNSTVLGRITIGKGSVIGGNVWLTVSVPPNSRILQGKPIHNTFSDGLGI